MGGLDGDVEGFVELARAGFNPLIEPLAFEEGHRDEGLPFKLIDFVDRADIGMVQSRRRLRLTLKTLENVFVRDKVSRQKLQSHRALELGVVRLIDDTHPALTEFVGDLVVRDGSTDHDNSILLLLTELFVPVFDDPDHGL